MALTKAEMAEGGKRLIQPLILALVLTCAFTSRARADSISAEPWVRIYSGDSWCPTCAGAGWPYWGLVGSFHSPDIMFATDTGYHWNPFGEEGFGGLIKGGLEFPSGGAYTFTMTSDDGSELYIKGRHVIEDGGPHPPEIASGSITLAAGDYPFEIQFFECCHGRSGVDLDLPRDVSFAPSPIPEPCAWLLLLTGAAAIPLRRRFQ